MTARRVVVAVLLSLASVLLGAGTAGAAAGPGLVMEPDHVEPGARDVMLVFRMTDDPAAPTTGFRLFLPSGRPLVGVTAPEPPGWTANLTTTALPAPAPSADGPVTEIVSAVAWTATGPRSAGAVDFTLHVDLMPEGAGPVRIRAACSDAAGGTVEWTDIWAEGGPKPAHDALKLALGAPPRPEVVAAGGHNHGGAVAPPTAAPAGAAATLAVVLGATAALAALLKSLSRRQHHHLDRSMDP